MKANNVIGLENSSKTNDELRAIIIQLYARGADILTVQAATGISKSKFYAMLRSVGRDRYQALKRLHIRKLRNHALEICRIAAEQKGWELSVREITDLIPKRKRIGTPVTELHRLLAGQDERKKAIRHKKYRALIDGKVVMVTFDSYEKLAKQVQILYAQAVPYSEIQEQTGFTPDYIMRAIKFNGQTRYDELRLNRKQAQLKNVVDFCLPICKSKRRALYIHEIRARVPKAQRHGLNLSEVRQQLIERGHRAHGRKYTRKELLDYLVEFAKELGHKPTVNDLRKAKKIDPSIYTRYFGGLVKARIQAGLE